MNYKSFINIFVFSAVIFLSFLACSKQQDEKKDTAFTQKTLSDSLQDRTGYIVDYLKIGNEDFLFVDTIQSVNNIDIINTTKDSIKLKLDSNTEIIFQTLSFDSTGNFKFNEKLNYKTFINLVSSKDFDRFRNIPFKFIIKNNTALLIEEIYIP